MGQNRRRLKEWMRKAKTGERLKGVVKAKGVKMRL